MLLFEFRIRAYYRENTTHCNSEQDSAGGFAKRRLYDHRMNDRLLKSINLAAITYACTRMTSVFPPPPPSTLFPFLRVPSTLDAH